MRPFTGTVAITGLNATDNPGPGLAVATSLRADPAFQGRIVGLAYDVLDPGLYAPGVLDASFLIPYPSVGRDALLSRLAHIQRTVGIDVLLPTLDSELPNLLEQEAILTMMGIETFLPSKDAFDGRAKQNLDALRENHDVAVPQGVALTSISGLYSLPFGFPMVVKSPLYGATVCWSLEEAVSAFHKQAAKWGLPIIAQQFVSGEEVNACAVGDGRGGLIGAVCMKKMLITDSGKGWAGVTVHDPALLELTEQVVRATKWRGPLEVEAIRDRTGNTWLIEVNPRFPAWADLCRGAGQNQPLAVCRLAMGQEVEPWPTFDAGVAFVRISANHIVSIQALEALTVTGESLPAERRTA